jgi:DNA repair protein RadC
MKSTVAEVRTEYRSDDAVIEAARRILVKRLKQPGAAFSSPNDVKAYLTLQLAQLESERFDVLFLDVKNRMIRHEAMFAGTVTSSTVHPREVVKLALALNATGVILAHNHPSGVAEPSDADHRLTRALTQALGLIDVRVLDHIIVAGVTTYSFAEHGLV